MRQIFLYSLLVLTANALQANGTHPVTTAPPDTPPIYFNPEQIPEHDWDRDLFRKDVKVNSAHLEFLYWQALEGGLSYALKSHQPAGESETTAAIGSYQNARFDIDPGFRIGLSYCHAPHYWEIWGQYTRMTSRGSNSAHPSKSDEYLNPVWTFPGSEALVKATSDIHLNYNVADFFFTRRFLPNPHLRLRLLAGVTGTWLDQNMNIKYYDAAAITDSIQTRWKYWGCGLRFGFTGDWFWIRDFYMTAKASVGVLIGPYKNQSKEQLSDTETLFRNAVYRDTRAVANLQVLVGPSYQKSFKKSRLELFAGCEFNTWSNLQEVHHSTVGPASAAKETWVNTGMLSLLGLTTRLTVDF